MTRRARHNYTLTEVALGVGRFAVIAVATQTRRSHKAESELADLEGALARVSDDPYEALTLRGLKRFTNVEAADLVQVHPNTMSRRYMQGLRSLLEQLNDPEKRTPPRRTVEWRDWAIQNSDEVFLSFGDPPSGGPGRPPQISGAVDERVLELHCAGATERAIALTLNAEFQRADRGTWTRSSVRSVLRRYQAPRRPRGKRRAPGSYTPGDITTSNYREIEFGEQLCDPAELLKRARR